MGGGELRGGKLPQVEIAADSKPIPTRVLATFGWLFNACIRDRELEQAINKNHRYFNNDEPWLRTASPVH
jgi:hypothetical protein